MSPKAGLTKPQARSPTSGHKDRPRHLENVDLEIGDGWRSALSGLTDDVIEREFVGILDKRRRNALAARRDALLGN